MHASREVEQNPIGRDRFVTNGKPVVLYQDGDTTVTTVYFESAGHRYMLDELTAVERVEHGSWLQARRFELWARYGRQRVRVFYCFQSTEFGQVCRALTRAREYAGLA